MTYLWESQKWYRFKWDVEKLSDLMSEVAYEQGWILGQLEHLNLEHQNETQLQTLTEDVLKSSEIEGELLPADQVRSSVARRLGLDIGGLVASDRNVDGIVEVLTDASVNYMESLSKNRLFGWHAALFPTGYSGMRKITVGNWRLDEEGPMQVVSGGIGREKVHFEAPAAKFIPGEMEEFLSWFESSALKDGPIKAGLAHLWFVTIHPFDDGNGRIARALSDMVLSRSEKQGKRFYSMSSQIREERKQYYELLESTQKGWVDVNQWLEWFLGCLHRSILNSNETVSAVMVRANFWQKFAQEPMNERQIKVLSKLLDNFEGKLTTSKWAKLAGCSQDSALRDIKHLVARGALSQDEGGGRNTSYSLVPQ